MECVLRILNSNRHEIMNVHGVSKMSRYSWPLRHELMRSVALWEPHSSVIPVWLVGEKFSGMASIVASFRFKGQFCNLSVLFVGEINCLSNYDVARTGGWWKWKERKIERKRRKERKFSKQKRLDKRHDVPCLTLRQTTHNVNNKIYRFKNYLQRVF